MNWIGFLTIFVALIIVISFITSISYEIKSGGTFWFNFFDKSSRQSNYFISLSPFVFLICIWYLLSYSSYVDKAYLPTPNSVVSELWIMLSSGDIFSNIATSLLRIVIAFSLASVVGFLLGSLAGTFTKFHSLIIPLNSSLRYIPPTAFISLTIIWFGIQEAGKIALIYIGVVFYITQMISDVVKLVPRIYIEAAQMLGANRYEIFKKIILAYTMPEVLSVLRVNLGAAWTFLIVAELVAAQRGIGYLMAISQRFLQTPKLFALIFIVGFLGFASDFIFGRLIKYVSRWKP
jgi:NitT/TauT family transport system permease protein